MRKKTFWSLTFCALIAHPVCAAARLPDGFVYLRDVDPSIAQDIRYAGSHNFLGRPADGYGAAECVLAAPAAAALKQAQEKLAAQNLSLIVWDCYRPARAVRDFVRWTANADDRMKVEFFPHIEKTQLVPLGYIAARSRHSVGGAVDVGLIPTGARSAAPPMPEKRASCVLPKGERYDDGTIDFGTGYDCFDPMANIGAAKVSPLASANRKLLADAMTSVGFKTYPTEWWHFDLRIPAFEQEFDFEITPR